MWDEGKFRLNKFCVGDVVIISNTDIVGIVAEIHPNGWCFGLDGEKGGDFYWQIPWADTWEKV